MEIPRLNTAVEGQAHRMAVSATLSMQAAAAPLPTSPVVPVAAVAAPELALTELPQHRTEVPQHLPAAVQGEPARHILLAQPEAPVLLLAVAVAVPEEVVLHCEQVDPELRDRLF